MWADSLSLAEVVSPLVEPDDNSELGAGRVGVLPEPTTLDVLISQTAAAVGATVPRRVGGRPIERFPKLASRVVAEGVFWRPRGDKGAMPDHR